jgi:hypothetical protein
MGCGVVKRLEQRSNSHVAAPAFNSQGPLPDCRQETGGCQSLGDVTLETKPV